MVEHPTHASLDLESRLEREVQAFCALAGERGDVPLLTCEIAATVFAMCATLRRLEQASVPDALIAALVAPAVETKLASPFFSRIRTWPRGYPGDFETIEYLVRGETSLSDRGFGEALDRLFATNIVERQPYLSWMRHFGNWRLTERSHEELCPLAHGLPLSASVTLDPTGLAWLARFDSALVAEDADADVPAATGPAMEAWQ